MTFSDSSSDNMETLTESGQLEQSAAYVTPPIGVTPPQVLAREAAEGRRGAAWRLLYWVMEDDPRAVIAIGSLDDDRLAHHLLAFIALGTWAGKPFVVPRQLCFSLTRTPLSSTLFPYTTRY